MNDPMKLLKADHREVERMFSELERTEDPGERATLAQQLQTNLAAHMAIEEQLVYPLVTDRLGEEQGEEAEIEHGLAREGVERLVAMCDQPGFGAALEMVRAGIKHHVEEEEGELLPDLKDAIERDEWTELGDQIAAHRAEAGLEAEPTARRRTTQSKGRSKAAAGRSSK